MRLIEWPETDDCVEWPFARSRAGYGQTFRDGKVIYVHRYVFEVVNGELPRVVRHSCDNPPCYNPRHLLGGTQLENMQDARDRGRVVPWRKIPDEVIAQWAERYRAGEKSSILAAEYGCRPESVCRAIRRVDPALTRSQHGRRRWV